MGKGSIDVNSSSGSEDSSLDSSSSESEDDTPPSMSKPKREIISDLSETSSESEISESSNTSNDLPSAKTRNQPIKEKGNRLLNIANPKSNVPKITKSGAGKPEKAVAHQSEKDLGAVKEKTDDEPLKKSIKRPKRVVRRFLGTPEVARKTTVASTNRQVKRQSEKNEQNQNSPQQEEDAANILSPTPMVKVSASVAKKSGDAPSKAPPKKLPVWHASMRPSGKKSTLTKVKKTEEDNTSEQKTPSLSKVKGKAEKTKGADAPEDRHEDDPSEFSLLPSSVASSKKTKEKASNKARKEEEADTIQSSKKAPQKKSATSIPSKTNESVTQKSKRKTTDWNAPLKGKTEIAAGVRRKV